MNSEVDVFVIPHTRMKQLVKETSNQVFGTDFSDAFAVEGLLNSLNLTFHEFKHHEEIENQYILAKLKTRVTASDLLELLSDIHHDTHVKDILTLVKKAVGHGYGDSQQWLPFKVELQKAVKEFIDDFLPHMREEEEIFQPLLSTYFTRNELRNLREQVLRLHTLTLNEERQPVKGSLIEVNSNSKDSEFCRLPNELLLQIFSYLSPRDLCRCAQVCRQWSEVSWDGPLWQQLHPVRWIFRDDWRTCMDEYEPCTCNDGSCVDKNNQWDRESLFSGGDSVDSGESYEEEIDQRRLEIETNQENNIRRLILMARYLIPAIGDHAKVLVLGCCPGLTNGLVYKILSHCKNLEYLDLSQNNVSDLGLNGLFRKNGGKALRHLDLSGCAKITDKTLKKLSLALTARVTNNRAETGDEQGDCCQEELMSLNEGLRYISLSGCFQITDDGIRVLSRNDNLTQLTHLDLSGCLNLSARGLQDLVLNCPSLRHESLFYCDNISEGPYPDTASGCQNLECTGRVCCRSALYE